MRVLSESDQKAIYDALYEGYKRSSVRFYLSRDNLRTIDGEMEAVYGWLTVNVLVGHLCFRSFIEISHYSLAEIYNRVHNRFSRFGGREYASCLPVQTAFQWRFSRYYSRPFLEVISLVWGEGGSIPLRKLSF